MGKKNIKAIVGSEDFLGGDFRNLGLKSRRAYVKDFQI